MTLKVPYVDLASLVSGGLQLKRDVVRGVGNIASSAARAKLAYAGAVAGANTYSLRQHLIGPRHLQTTFIYHITLLLGAIVLIGMKYEL